MAPLPQDPFLSFYCYAPGRHGSQVKKPPNKRLIFLEKKVMNELPYINLCDTGIE